MSRWPIGRSNRPWEVVEVDMGYATPCHIWQGYINPLGYGYIGSRPAHRVAYERAHGATSFDIHHLCEVKACVNQEHLEAISRSEHILRHRRMPDGEVISALADCIQTLGRRPQMLEWDDIKPDTAPCSRNIALRWGYWNTALALAEEAP